MRKLTVPETDLVEKRSVNFKIQQEECATGPAQHMVSYGINSTEVVFQLYDLTHHYKTVQPSEYSIEIVSVGIAKITIASWGIYKLVAIG